MKYEYCVKHNGKYYSAGEEIPADNIATKIIKEETPAKVETPEADNKVSLADIEGTNNVMVLRKIAKENNIALAKGMSVREIKDLMISVLGL